MGHGVASEHCFSPSPHPEKIFSPSTDFTMSASEPLRRRSSRKNPPLGPFVESTKPLRLKSCSILAIKDSGESISLLISLIPAFSPALDRLAMKIIARIAYSHVFENIYSTYSISVQIYEL